MAEAATVSEGALRRFCEEALKKLGVPAGEARTTTDVLVTADLRGIESHGVARLGRYVAGLKKGFMRPTDQSRIIKETKATALVDGGQSLGQVIGRKGMDLAIKKARDTAVGVVAVRNSNHYGIAGYYSLMALEHNLIGISTTNAGPLVVPTFGRTSILGTNPISLAAPAMNEKAFVLDMATSTVPAAKSKSTTAWENRCPTDGPLTRPGGARRIRSGSWTPSRTDWGAACCRSAERARNSEATRDTAWP